MNEPKKFQLKLRKSALKYKLRALEGYRDWFPPGSLVFELKGEGRTYKTHIDRQNRLKLDDILKQHPDTKAGDYLVFTPSPDSRQWDVQVQHYTSTIGGDEEVSRQIPKEFNHDGLRDMLVELAEFYGMHPEAEYPHEYHRYDVIWKRIKSGSPTKVFEVQVSGSIESALTKLKHASDLWSADVFLVVTNTRDAEKVAYLLTGSFHEIASKTTILRGEEVYEMLAFKRKYGDIEDRMKP
jgi:hypothetical protein